MTTLFVQPGDILNFTPAANVAVNQVVLFGSVLGVAATNIPANSPGPLMVKGVFNLPKVAGVAFGEGDKLLWSVAGGGFTEGAGVAGDLASAGICASPALAGDTTVAVLLNPGLGSIVA